MKYIIAHDVGTQSNKAVLISTSGKVYKISEKKYGLNMPRPGWVEQKPMDYWDAICETTKDVISNLDDKNDVLAMVFSTQSMGIIPVNKSGEVLYDNISWVDSRANNQSKKIMNRFLGKSIFKAIIGVELSGKDVIPKIRWIKEQRESIYNNTYKILDVNGFLKYKCTGKMVAEWSGACSYGFNLKVKDWERLFFKVSGIDIDKLPDLVKSTDLVGNLTNKASQELGLPTSVKIFGGCDDTQSAAMGSGQIKDNQAHIYLGTSAWIGISSQKNNAFKMGVASLQSADPASTLLVGITESAGANIEWALNKFYSKEKEEGIDVYKLMEKEVSEITAGSEGLIFTPWFLGERTPITDTTVRSTIFNLGFEHSRGHIMNSLLEGIVYNLRWTIDNIAKEYKIKIKELTVIGGGAQNDAWMQGLSNNLGIKINTTENPKLAGAIGSAMTAMVGLGLEKDFNSVTKFNPIHKTFIPSADKKEVYTKAYENYKLLYKSLKETYFKVNYKRFNSN